MYQDDPDMVSRQPGVDYAIAAIAKLHSSQTGDQSATSVRCALTEIDSTLNSGEAKRGGDIILGMCAGSKSQRVCLRVSALTILLYYHLHQGVWLQNCRYSNAAMGFCNSAGLYIDPDRMPLRFGYATGSVKQQGQNTYRGRLFWLTYVLYIQV